MCVAIRAQPIISVSITRLLQLLLRYVFRPVSRMISRSVKYLWHNVAEPFWRNVVVPLWREFKDLSYLIWIEAVRPAVKNVVRATRWARDHIISPARRRACQIVRSVVDVTIRTMRSVRDRAAPVLLRAKLAIGRLCRDVLVPWGKFLWRRVLKPCARKAWCWVLRPIVRALCHWSLPVAAAASGVLFARAGANALDEWPTNTPIMVRGLRCTHLRRTS